jgi:hypothetical protein
LEKSNRGAWPTITNAAINRELERYARRGVFRSFSRAGDEFHFHWLRDLPFHLNFDREAGALIFPKLLPNVARGSDLELGLKTFVDSFGAQDRPAHRRIDPAKLKVRYANRRGAVTLKFAIAGNDPEYAVKKALQLVNEVFLGFLSLHHPEYMAENFRLPLE